MEIELHGKYANGRVALIDDADEELIGSYRWAYCDGYARASVYLGRKNGRSIMQRVSMHRLILGLVDPKDKTDHRNHDGLDNRRENLRKATHAQNHQNGDCAQLDTNAKVASDRPDSDANDPPIRRPRHAGFIAWPLALILAFAFGALIKCPNAFTNGMTEERAKDRTISIAPNVLEISARSKIDSFPSRNDLIKVRLAEGQPLFCEHVRRNREIWDERSKIDVFKFLIAVEGWRCIFSPLINGSGDPEAQKRPAHNSHVLGGGYAKILVENDYIKGFIGHERVLRIGASGCVSRTSEMRRNPINRDMINPRPGILGRYSGVLTISEPNADCRKDKNEVEKQLQTACPSILRHNSLTRLLIWICSFVGVVGLGSAIVGFPHCPRLWLCILILSVLLLYGTAKVDDYQFQCATSFYCTEGQCFY